MKNSKYKFIRSENSNDKFLICPECLETVSNADIENYSFCPYCNHRLELNGELENYILQPAIDMWMEQCTTETDSNKLFTKRTEF